MKSMFVLFLSVVLIVSAVSAADDATEVSDSPKSDTSKEQVEKPEVPAVEAVPKPVKKVTKEEAQQFFAVALNNRAWELLGKAERTPEETREMIQAAHGSCWHWRFNGEAVNQQRGEWLIAKVYCELGMAEPALYHAHHCRDITVKYAKDMKDFDLAYSWEIIARATALNKNSAKAVEYLNEAKNAAEAIQGPEDKEIFLGDLNSGNWYGVKL